jgi:hypothetical protein
LLALVLLVAMTTPARGDGAGGAGAGSGQVALLPLDADQQLEIYGQPVASEIARALIAGGVDVIVVGARTTVPKDVAIIVDGKITAAKGDAVTLSIRVRDVAGNTLETLTTPATALVDLDRVTTELAGRLLPTIRGRLAGAPPPHTHDPDRSRPPAGRAPPPPATAPPAAPPPAMLVAVTGTTSAAFTAALTRAIDPWARDHHRDPRAVTPPATAPLDLPKLITGEHAALGVVLDVIAYTTVDGRAPMVRARIRIRIADPTTLAFDRVIATDTIVGERGMAADALADRAAREVLAILDLHVLRAVPSWRP